MVEDVTQGGTQVAWLRPPAVRRRSGRAGVLHLRAAVSLLAMLAMTATACGDSGSTTSAPPPAETSTTALPGTTAAETTPEALGDRIAEVYVEALEDVVAATADRPEPAAAMTALQELKERHIEVLVELGHQREALDTAGRSAVDNRIGLAVGRISTDLFAAYQQAQADYRGIDAEVAELIASFNIITQYASFDLLRKQEPEEAARLLGD